jgi:hypothetical protein
MPVFQGFDGNGNARYAAGAANQLVGTALPKLFAGLTNNILLWKMEFKCILKCCIRSLHLQQYCECFVIER